MKFQALTELKIELDQHRPISSDLMKTLSKEPALYEGWHICNTNEGGTYLLGQLIWPFLCSDHYAYFFSFNNYLKFFRSYFVTK